MAEQQVENTQVVEAPVIQATEQVQSIESQQTEQTKGQDSVDLTKTDPTQLTPEQIIELQKGYLRQADYTRKTQEIAAQRKQVPNYAEIVQSEEFLNWAKQMGLVGQSAEQQKGQEPEFMQSFSEDQKQALQYMFQNAIKPYANTISSQVLATQDKELTTKYGKEIVNESILKAVNDLQQDIIKNRGATWREEVFKIVDYDSAIKRSYEAGRQEGLKGQQIRKDVNVSQSTTNVNNIQSRSYEDSDKPDIRLKKIFDNAQRKIGQYQGSGVVNPRIK